MLESEDRKIWQNPNKILGAVALQLEWVAADLGCGSGYFTVPLSFKVKKVYAIDVQKEMLSFLEDKIKHLKIKNIELLLSDADEIPLEDECVDFLISVNTLHEFGDRKTMISEMKRVIKRDGRLLIVDFKKEETEFGPPAGVRVSKKQAISLFEGKGFALSKSSDMPYHYLLVFVKA